MKINILIPLRLLIIIRSIGLESCDNRVQELPSQEEVPAGTAAVNII
jgi:hypothetical protein